MPEPRKIQGPSGPAANADWPADNVTADSLPASIDRPRDQQMIRGPTPLDGPLGTVQLDPVDGEVLTSGLVRRHPVGHRRAVSTGSASGSKSTTDTSSGTSMCLLVSPPRRTLSEFAITSNPSPRRYACTFPAGRYTASNRSSRTRFSSSAASTPGSSGKSSHSRANVSRSSANARPHSCAHGLPRPRPAGGSLPVAAHELRERLPELAVPQQVGELLEPDRRERVEQRHGPVERPEPDQRVERLERDQDLRLRPGVLVVPGRRRTAGCRPPRPARTRRSPAPARVRLDRQRLRGRQQLDQEREPALERSAVSSPSTSPGRRTPRRTGSRRTGARTARTRARPSTARPAASVRLDADQLGDRGRRSPGVVPDGVLQPHYHAGSSEGFPGSTGSMSVAVP